MVEVTSVTEGAVVSMTIDLFAPREPAAPGAGRVKTAALGLVVTVSKIVPPFKLSALVLV